MAIKSRVDGNGKTWYLYAECEVQSGAIKRLCWKEESDRHRECVGAKGASNERQLLEVPDSLDDDVARFDGAGEDHADWLQVDESGDPVVYDVSEVSGARDAWYMDQLRAERNDLMKEADDLCMRHRDQVDNSEDPTSLDGTEYGELLDYKKALRDWPADESDIYDRTAPTKPSWM